ncbi:MAG: MerR family transcriptional regulator [Coprobacillus sp.]
MKIKEVSQKYNITETALRYYEKVGLFDDVKRINNIREYEDKDIERLSMIMSLKKVGLHIQAILRFLKLMKDNRDTRNERILILNKQRQELMDQIHQYQKNLDSLDFLIYELKDCHKCDHKEDLWKQY